MYYFFINIVSLQNILTINFLYKFLSKLREFQLKKQDQSNQSNLITKFL